MKRIVISLFWICSALFLLVTEDAQAEGRCPPGQYPIGGQGVGGCAPMPGSNGGDAGSSGPVATGRWIKTWGAIATAVSTGDMGASVGRRSKQEASSEALSRCASHGARDCKVGTTYKNQCVAYADPERGVRAVSPIRLQAPRRRLQIESCPIARTSVAASAKFFIQIVLSRSLSRSSLMTAVTSLMV